MKLTVYQLSDYPAFGSPIPTRQWNDPNSKYKYGFNGMEKDDDINVNGGSYDFGARIYDSRLGRWLSLDPLMVKYPFLSPYVGLADNPILYIDFDGRDIIVHPVTETYTGPSTPNCLSELAHVEFVINLVFKVETGKYNFVLERKKVLSSGFVKIAARNGKGFSNFVHTHEDEHAKRLSDAAYKIYSYTYNGKLYPNQRLDEMMTNIYNDNFAPKYNALDQWYIDKKAEILKNASDAKSRLDKNNIDAYNAGWEQIEAEKKAALATLEEEKKTAEQELDDERFAAELEVEELFMDEEKATNSDKDETKNGVVKTAITKMDMDGKRSARTPVVNQYGDRLDNKCP